MEQPTDFSLANRLESLSGKGFATATIENDRFREF
jgi:hypothetical protein